MRDRDPIRLTTTDGDEIVITPAGGTSDGDMLVTIGGALTPTQLIALAGWIHHHRPRWYGIDQSELDGARALYGAWTRGGHDLTIAEDEEG